MKRTAVLKAIVVATALPLLYLADVSPGSRSGITLVRDAYAIVGAPMTPMSVAGVARRSTVVVASASAASAATASAASQQQAATAKQQSATAQQQSATAQQQAATAQQQAAVAQQQAAARPPGAPAVGSMVSALPAGCRPETRNGVEYQNCGGVYYRAAFQGNTLVFVVQ